MMLKAMSGFDERDSTSLKREPDWQKPSLKGMKVGIPKEYRLPKLPKDISELWQKAADRLANEGVEVLEVSLPHTRYALPAYYIVAPAEASSNLARYDGARYGLRVESDNSDQMYSRTRRMGFGDEVTRRILIGSYVLSAGYYEDYYLKASKVRRRILEDFENVFAKVDTLLTPTTPTAAFPLDEKQDFMTMYINDVLTVPASMAGDAGYLSALRQKRRRFAFGVAGDSAAFERGADVRPRSRTGKVGGQLARRPKIGGQTSKRESRDSKTGSA